MRIHGTNIVYWLKNAVFKELLSGGPHRLLGGLAAVGQSVPADGGEGYQKGCIFINLGATSNADLLYANIGSATSCNFNAITVAAD